MDGRHLYAKVDLLVGGEGTITWVLRLAWGSSQCCAGRRLVATAVAMVADYPTIVAQSPWSVEGLKQ